MSKEVYKLKTPIQFGSQEITELEFRTMEAGDLRGMSLDVKNMGFSEMLDLLAKLCGQAPGVVNRMTLTDAMGAMTVLGKLLPVGLPTGNQQ